MTKSSKAVANVQANRSKQYLENYDRIFKTQPSTPEQTPAADSPEQTPKQAPVDAVTTPPPTPSETVDS